MAKDRESWCAAVHGVTKSWTRLRDWTELKLTTLAILSDSYHRHIINEMLIALPQWPRYNNYKHKLDVLGLPWWLSGKASTHPPMQRTWVWPITLEDCIWHKAMTPVSYNYWTCALEAGICNCWAHKPQLLKPHALEPMLNNKRRHCSEKPMRHS